MAAFDDPSVAPALLQYWRGYSPAARVKVIAAMLSVQPRVPVLLKALEEGQVEIAALDVAARTRLLEQGDRARRLLQDQAGDRAKVVEAYRDVLKLNGELTRVEATWVDRRFLKVLGIGADYIKDVLRQLTAGRSAWVPNVSISEKVLRTAGFVSIGNLARSN